MKLIDQLTDHEFKKLPLVTEGESKEVRYLGKGLVVIKLKPTIYSYTHNRSGEIAGSDTLRLQTIKSLLPVLEEVGINHSYRYVNDHWIVSQLVLQPLQKDSMPPFRPTDLTDKEINALPVAPPIEVVVKNRHVGTPKHRYYHLDHYPTRQGWYIKAENEYPHTVVRFDWRNPMVDTAGQRLADEVITEEMANWYIDVKTAHKTALTAFNGLHHYLSSKGLDLWDICFFISQDGTTMFGEVSPDCLRVRASDGSSLDKDIWRHGGSSHDVKEKWSAFASLIKGGYDE